MAAPYILIVDDDEFTQAIFQHILEEAGYVVRFAGNYQQAVAHVNAQLPALILMDYMLPSADGIALTRVFKQDANTGKIPIIMITGEAVREVLEKSKRAGVDDFIVKPVDRNVLIKKVKSLIKA